MTVTTTTTATTARVLTRSPAGLRLQFAYQTVDGWVGGIQVFYLRDITKYLEG
jgi:hypothetical protein